MSSKDTDKLKELYLSLFGLEPQCESLTGGGSVRCYYRLYTREGGSVIGVINNNIDENKTFVNLAGSFRNNGIHVPKIFAVSDDYTCYLEQDLGDISLFDLLNSGDKMELARKALEDLVTLQTIPELAWSTKTVFPPFSSRLVRWDLNYFKYDFLKACDIVFDEERLEDDFERMIKYFEDIPDNLHGFMYRDFQSRNIMYNEGQLWFIDFQGGRKGPLVYDAVSFLWQARAPFSYEERIELGDYYCNLMAKKRGTESPTIQKEILPFALFRTLQVLGAYGLRGLVQKKTHFLKSIVPAIRNLKYLKTKGATEQYPELSVLIDRISSEPFECDLEGDKLTVSVYSFSYKKGYPVDTSGNGGGFVFDCRGIHNPGRYEEFKALTGRDKKVKDFLSKDGEALKFVDEAIDLIKPTVERYISRGFISLSVGFGCTGGQHRSVFCAELFARTLSRIFPEIRVKLIHREQNIQFYLSEKSNK